MGYYLAQESQVIDARPEQVYGVVSDYRSGHPSILPRQYFTSLTVDKGGQGAGTAVTVHMNVYGTKAMYKMTVSEPEPGRVLMEEDPSAGVVTTFTFDPIDGGRQTRVTISTKARTSPGLKGVMEKLMTPMIARKIYRAELRQLADVVRSRSSA